MKKIICLVMAMFMLSTQAFAATYYNINIEGLTATEKREVVEWLEEEGYEYDVDSYTSSSSNSKIKEIVVEELTTSEKNTLVSWLKNRNYNYATKTKNGYYYVTIEYTSSNKSKLVDYLDSKRYSYEGAFSSNSSNRSGEAYLVANGVLWHAEGDDIEKVDSIYSPESILFTNSGAISYINESKYGMLIADVENPTDKEKISTSAKSINTNSTGYAISFKGTGGKTTKIESDYDFDNESVTVYVVKNNTLYSLSEKNKLTKLKSLKSVSTTSYAKNTSNIGFSEWGDLVLIDSSGVCFFNEDIDETDEIEVLKDQNGYTVQAKYFTVKDGIIQTVILSDGSVVRLEDD